MALPENLFQEDEEYGQHQAYEGREVVPVDSLSLEDEHHDDGEDRQGDYFLYHLELQQVERTAVALETYAVGRHGQAIFEEGYAPRKQYDQYEGPARGDFHLAEFEVAVPGESHEDVRKDEHHDGPDSVHCQNSLFGARR